MPRQSQLSFNNLSIPSTSTSRVPSSSPSIAPSITSSSNALPELDLLYDDLDSSSHSSNPASTTLKKKDRPRKSWVYNHMRGEVSRDYEFRDSKGRSEWRCRYCLQNYILSGGTKNIVDHLKWHGLYEIGERRVGKEC